MIAVVVAVDQVRDAPPRQAFGGPPEVGTGLGRQHGVEDDRAVAEIDDRAVAESEPRVGRDRDVHPLRHPVDREVGGADRNLRHVLGDARAPDRL
jgi:hypothetical protein